MVDAEQCDDETLQVVKCSACERRYLEENATIVEEDGEERCPFCGQHTDTSPSVPVELVTDGEEVTF